MELGRRIKELRQRDGISQEELAERIYVSRQTISNWETEKSCPDIQSLLLLGSLFDVSLDELVKGDLEMMKQQIDAYKMDVWSWIMLIGVTVGIVGAFPMARAFGLAGVVLSIVFMAIGFAASIVIERTKKKNNIETYEEIMAFMNATPADKEKVAEEQKHKTRSMVLKVLAGAAAGVLMCLVGVGLEWLIFDA